MHHHHAPSAQRQAPCTALVNGVLPLGAVHTQRLRPGGGQRCVPGLSHHQLLAVQELGAAFGVRQSGLSVGLYVGDVLLQRTHNTQK
jgi:hypothetical protein